MVDTPIRSPPMERLSCAPSLEMPLHRQFHLSLLILGQGAALWLLHGRIRCLRLSMTPPSPPVQQEAADGQQDQDDAGHQEAEGKPGELRARRSLLLLLVACVSQRNGVRVGQGPGRPLARLSSFRLRGAPAAPGAPSALHVPEGQRTAPGEPSGEPWLLGAGCGAAEASRGPRRGPGRAWLLMVSGRGRRSLGPLRRATLGRASGSRGARRGRG